MFEQMRLRPNIDRAAQLDTGAPATGNEWGWCVTVRMAIGLPITSLAARLHISKQAAHKLELSELDETISLTKLRGLANALDCELTYEFVPRTSFAQAARRIQMEQDKARRNHRKIPAPK